MRRRFSRDEILAFLRQAAAGTPVMDLCWNHCFSRSTFHAWKVKYGAAIQVEPKRRERFELRRAGERES
jgi:putative transposase